MEDKSLKRCYEYLEWKQTNGRIPCSRSTSEPEHSLGIWIVQMRIGARGRTRSKQMYLYPKVKELLESDDPEWLKTKLPLGNREQSCIKKANELVEWIKEYGRVPTSTVGNPEIERIHSLFLIRMRRAYHGKGVKIHESVKHILDQNIPGWINPKFNVSNI